MRTRASKTLQDSFASSCGKYVFVLVHADIWGAFNANWLLPEIRKRGAEPILIVSRSTPGKDGAPLTKVADFKLPRILKEEKLLEYFRAVDSQNQNSDTLTFRALAKRYCLNEEPYMTTRGGPGGGQEVQAIFSELEARGVVPDLVLSGDTLAILPESITGRYPCFSAHPGPLESIKIEGMQGTARAFVYRAFFDMQGNPLDEDDIRISLGGRCVKGTLFQQVPELDKGPPIASTLSLASIGMCLMNVRTDLYYGLIRDMINHLDVLLDPVRREKLLKVALERKRVMDSIPHRKVPEMEPEKFIQWLSNGVAFVHEEDDGSFTSESFQNSIVNPNYFAHRIFDFWPNKNEQEFNNVFSGIFPGVLEQIERRRHQVRNPWFDALEQMFS